MVVTAVMNGMGHQFLAGSAFSEQKAVIGRSSFHKCLRIGDQFFLLNLVAHQIIQINMLDVLDGNNGGLLVFPACGGEFLRACLAAGDGWNLAAGSRIDAESGIETDANTQSV